MRTHWLFAVAGLAALGLAACQKGAGSGSGVNTAAAPSAAAPAASAPAGPVAIDAPPHRKAGLWKQTMAGGDAPATMPTLEMCVDDASEAKVSALGSGFAKDRCPQQSFARNLDGSISFSSTCKIGEDGGQAVTHGTITGSFDSSYQVSVDTVTTGANIAAANGEHKLTMTGQWLGPCPAGEKGGDVTMIMPDGRTMRMPGLAGFHPPSPQG